MVEAAVTLARNLEAWLEQNGVSASVEVGDRATVGFSQETWLVDVSIDGSRSAAVLRLPTPSSGGRAIISQRAALQAVAGRVPAPALLWHDDGEKNPFGRPFIVMERVSGVIPVQWRDVSEPARTRLAEDAIDVLARIHAVKPASLRGAGSQASAPMDELDFYRRRLERFGALPAALRVGLRWLERHMPAPPARITLIHGDFRMGNLVIADERIAGILDWEMAGAGDPIADLAWCFIPVWGVSKLDEAALVDRYGDRCGVVVDPDRLRWQRILGYVRLAYYALSGIRAFADGHSHDLRLAALALQLPVHLDRLAATLAGDAVY